MIELETLAEQLDLFIDIPDGELLLKESLYSLEEAEALMADMVKLWKQGNEVKMNKLLFEDSLDDYPEFNKIYDSLFYDRNDKMTIKINDMLKQQGSYFVVVGTGHLIGEKGIVNLLKEKGYDLERR
ncbi:MAG: TraB/GumN family protein [Methylococcales bacterium]|nr:TraB/GumN family protein [Methylococcales bacterium]